MYSKEDRERILADLGASGLTPRGFSRLPGNPSAAALRRCESYCPDNARAEGFFGTLKEEFYNGRDWSQVGFDEFRARLDAYIEWYVDGRLKAFDEGGRKVYDTIAGRRRRLGYTV